MLYGLRIAGAAIAACFLAQAALAGDAFVTVRSVKVAYGDLDLGSAAGRGALQARIDAAAIKACGSNPVFDVNYRQAAPFLKADYAKCRAEAAREAMAALQIRGVQVAAAY